MGERSEVMHCYEQIAPLTERMLLRARSRDWGALPALEDQYSRLVERLKVIEPLEILDESQMAQKYRLLSRIHANHTEVCDLVTPQIVQLGAALQSLQQRNLLQAYSRH